MREERLINRGWQFALMPCTPIDAKTAKKREAERKKSGEDVRTELEDLHFIEVDLPHDWAVSRPFNKAMNEGGAQGFRDRWGIGWYKKILHIEEKKKEKRYFLYFGGVYENAVLWVNGVCIGSHKYGYSSFKMDITDAVQSGDNVLLMRVDNSVAPADRWYSGCGIYRDVILQVVPKNHLDPWNIQVHTKIGGIEENEEKAGEDDKKIEKINEKIEENAKIEEMKCTNKMKETERIARLSACIEVKTGQSGAVQGILRLIQSKEDKSPDSEVFIAEGTNGILTFHIRDAKLWSAEHPRLYRLTVSTENDSVSLSIGLRDVKFDAQKGMFVNGVPSKLKGVCLHQEAGCLGTAVTKEIWQERLGHLKNLGCNAIRAAHHTYSEEFLDLCDEMGFYVYEECFDKWKGGLYGRYFDENWEADVEAMVKRDRNRACIVIWGVGNEVENQGQDSMLAILKQLSDKVKDFDTSRPITYAMNPHFKRESNVDLSKIKDIQQFVDEVSDTEIYDARERVGRIAKIAEIVDLISCNYQEQWYELIHESIPNKLILGTEVYEYFCGHYEQMQNFTEKIPSAVPFESNYCIGSFIWTGYDYLGESMGYPAKGWSGALIHTNNEYRPIAYILKSIWSSEPVVHFSVMDYSLDDEGVKEHWDSPIYADHWHFPQFRKTLIPYMIASNCDEVHLFLNGKQFFIPRPSECKNGIITGFLPWQPGTVTVIGYQNGKEVCRHEIVTPGMAVALSFDQDNDQEKNNYYKNDQEKNQEKRVGAVKLGELEKKHNLLLTVRAVDENGNPCFRESAKVHFAVEGAAKIVGVDNGDICCNEPYQEESIHLYHGCASVIVELDGKPGRVCVCAFGNGLRQAQAVVEVFEK